MKEFFKRNWFLFGILSALVCGFFFSSTGLGLNPQGHTADALIVLLFLISGSMLPAEAVKAGLKEYKLHIFVQLFIFVFFPSFIFLTSLPLRALLGGEIVIGLYALACLPTTVSSCIVFTQSAEGNVTGAMFNASLANILGVAVSPLILSIMLRGGGQSLPAEEVFGVLKTLFFKMLLPIGAGQLLRRFIRERILRGKKFLRLASNIMILFLIFFAFSKTTSTPGFIANLRLMVWPFLYLACAHLVLVFFAYQGAKLLGLPAGSRIAAMFTAPQKTVAMGVPLISAFFARRPDILGIALLPLVFYHSYQLIVAGFLRSLSFIKAE